MSANLLAIFYLISGILFILALRGLSSPETSRKGNLFGIIGMAIAIAIPRIPKKFPFLEVSGDDSPLRANIKSTPEIKYNDAAKFGVTVLLSFFLFFVHSQHSLCYQKPTKYIYSCKHYR